MVPTGVPSYAPVVKTLVIGGSGFVGGQIVPALAARGHTTLVLSRHARDAPGTTQVFRGSAADFSAVETASGGCDAIVYLAGIIAEVGRQTFESVHVEGVRIAVRAARAAGVRRFLHMSALGVGPRSVSRYHKTKGDAEALVQTSGLDWTIFRPSLIYGPGDGFVGLQLSLTRWLPVAPMVGRGDNLFQPVAVADVAQAFVNALERTAAVGAVYDLGGPDRLSYRQLLQDVLKAAGRRRFIFPIPLRLARAAATVGDKVWPGRLLQRPAPLTRDQTLMLACDNVGDPGPARRDLDFCPIRWTEGLRQRMGSQTV